jgi:hypothetical protein
MMLKFNQKNLRNEENEEIPIKKMILIYKKFGMMEMSNSTLTQKYIKT